MTYQIYIYTLALKDGYYYVGKTIDPDRRFNEHFSDKGAVWTKLHPPVSKRIFSRFFSRRRGPLGKPPNYKNDESQRLANGQRWLLV